LLKPEESYVDSRISRVNVMISQTVITQFSKSRNLWNSLHPQRNRRSNATGLLASKRRTGLLAMAGAAAMESLVGEVWLGNGCEPASIRPVTQVNIVAKKPHAAHKAMIAGHQPALN
jgi:hypothetical protein